MHFQGEFGEDVGSYGSLADLIRQIDDDERLHRNERR